jgi:hypothetical protein
MSILIYITTKELSTKKSIDSSERPADSDGILQ